LLTKKNKSHFKTQQILWPWFSLCQQGCGPLVPNTPQSSPNQTVKTKALSPFDIWIVLSRTDEFAFPVQLILAALGFIPVFLES